MVNILTTRNIVSVLVAVSERLRESEDLLGRLRELLVHSKEKTFLKTHKRALKVVGIGIRKSNCRNPFKLNSSRYIMAPEGGYPKL